MRFCASLRRLGGPPDFPPLNATNQSWKILPNLISLSQAVRAASSSRATEYLLTGRPVYLLRIDYPLFTICEHRRLRHDRMVVKTVDCVLKDDWDLRWR
jgi:hypothetical protein